MCELSPQMVHRVPKGDITYREGNKTVVLEEHIIVHASGEMEGQDRKHGYAHNRR